MLGKHRLGVLLIVAVLSHCNYVSAICKIDKTDTSKLTCKNVNLSQINAVENKDTFSVLEIINGGDKIERLTRNGLKFQNLKSLLLDSIELRDLNNDAFSNIQTLESLTIQFTELRSIRQKSFNKLSQVKELRVTSSKVRRIAANSFNTLSDLQILDLSFNEIREIEPKLFDQLSHLELLNLGSNRIQTLPTELLINLYKLKELRLDTNQLTSLPENLFKTKPILERAQYKSFESNLEILNLEDNRIETLNENSFSYLSKLKKLNLGQNSIKKFNPNAFTSLTNLQSINLEYSISNEEILPIVLSKLSDLPSLQNLALEGNKIKTFNGSSWKNLDQMEKIAISQNKITDPTDLFSYVTNLKLLDLSQNLIKRITRNSFSELRLLTELNLNNNEIDEIQSGSFFQLKNLIKLHLNTNKIREINFGIFDSGHNKLDLTSRLLFLDLSRNEINVINPAALKNLKNLLVLNLSSNKISTLPEDLLNNLNQIETLDLAYNKISEFPEDFLNPVAKSLTELDLSYNEIRNLNPDLFTELRVIQKINLKNNKLVTVNPELLAVPSLREVILNLNEISYLPTDLLHGVGANLEELHFYGNKLTYIENEFFENTHLKMVSFGRNPWICKCLDDMVEVLRANNIKFSSSEYTDGSRPTCVVGPNNTCILNSEIQPEILRQYYAVLNQYPNTCINPEEC